MFLNVQLLIISMGQTAPNVITIATNAAHLLQIVLNVQQACISTILLVYHLVVVVFMEMIRLKVVKLVYCLVAHAIIPTCVSLVLQAYCILNSVFPLVPLPQFKILQPISVLIAPITAILAVVPLLLVLAALMGSISTIAVAYRGVQVPTTPMIILKVVIPASPLVRTVHHLQVV